MSDPSHAGPYECHGPMQAIPWNVETQEIGAYLCLTCGVWRAGFPRDDPRRADVARVMPRMLAQHGFVAQLLNAVGWR